MGRILTEQRYRDSNKHSIGTKSGEEMTCEIMAWSPLYSTKTEGMGYNENKHSNYQKNPRKGKGSYVPGKPKTKAYQHQVDSSGPVYKLPKPQQIEANNLLLEVYAHMDKHYPEQSHGLKSKITEYMIKYNVYQNIIT